MRTVALSSRFSLDFSGNVLQNAICLGDVDNDGEVELVVGNSSGELAVFKDTDADAWRRSSNLGHVTAVAVGDLFNQGRNVVVAITAEGLCYIYDFSRPGQKCLMEDEVGGMEELRAAEEAIEARVRKSSKEKGDEEVPQPQPSSTVSPEVVEDHRKLYPIAKQRIPANVKEVIIFDINNDGNEEMVVALTDRVVRTYQWQSKHGGPDGFLASVNKWEFGSQVGSITRNRNSDGTNALIVAQPGGALLKVSCKKTNDLMDPAKELSSPSALMSKISDMNYEPMASHQMRNANVSSEIQGCLEDGGGSSSSRKVSAASSSSIETTSSSTGVDDKSTPYVIATLDGNLILAKNDQVIWNLQTNRQLFCVRKMDVNGDGLDEILVSAWSGHTYIVTQKKKAMEFIFDESICAFTCGKYTVDGCLVPVLVYVTFSGKIFIYYDIKMETDDIATLNLVAGEETSELLREFDISITSPKSLSNLNEYLLYHVPLMGNKFV